LSGLIVLYFVVSLQSLIFKDW